MLLFFTSDSFSNDPGACEIGLIVCINSNPYDPSIPDQYAAAVIHVMACNTSYYACTIAEAEGF